MTPKEHTLDELQRLVKPIGFVRPDQNCSGRWVFINYYEGRNPALAWQEVSAMSPDTAKKLIAVARAAQAAEIALLSGDPNLNSLAIAGLRTALEQLKCQ